MADDRTSRVQLNLDRLRGGDDRARGELLALARDRLVALTRVMLRDYGRLRRWEQTDDVLQNALIRLDRALREVTPGSARDFYGLATLQVRRELIDLARHHYGPEGWGARHASGQLDGSGDADGDGRPLTPEAPDLTHEPGRLAAWGEFHVQAESLPDDEREVFGLVWYQGLTHGEAAEILGVSTKTVQRRWHSACLRLHDVMGGDLPGF
jgi:RNA polymerase sigma factor (sigma-70 family)